MKPNFKDRKPAPAGSRSFFPAESFVIFVILLSAAAAFFWHAARLVAVVQPENAEPFAFSTRAGDEFRISLTHSVEKTSWDDYFLVRGADDLLLAHTRFSSLGWGYPYAASEGRLALAPDGRFDLEMNRPYTELALRVSDIAGQRLIHGEDVYDLVKLYGQGTAVTIRVVHRYEYWRSRI